MRNEYIVVTILVAADGSIKLPQISSLDDLKTALKRLGGVRARPAHACIRACISPCEPVRVCAPPRSAPKAVLLSPRAAPQQRRA